MHRTASRSRQRGLSFFGLIFVGLFGVAAFAIGGQSIPIFLEYHLARPSKRPRESTVPEMRAAFDRAAAIDNITFHQGQGPGSHQAWRQGGGVFQVLTRDCTGRPCLSWCIALKRRPTRCSRLY
jgi:hypothetical protein